jgi:hypothetical protein
MRCRDVRTWLHVESNSLTTVPANFTGQPVAASVIKTATSWGTDGKG